MSSPVQAQSKPKVFQFHGTLPRGLGSVPRSASFTGRFGRLFRTLPAYEPADADLVALATTMIEKPVDVEEADAPSNMHQVTAGFTYLGQFIDHDLTFDPNSKLQRENDPDALEDFRTPRFDLDNVYGRGPSDSPFLYDAAGEKFVIGKNEAGEDDLPRNANGRALIGDPRNDENLIVSQIQLAMLKFHNKVVDALPAGDGRFEEARQMVRWHYQWILVHDFLPKIVGQNLINDILRRETYGVETGTGLKHAAILRTNLRFYHYKVEPFMPLEFSVGAYRYGHSMVRFNYTLNSIPGKDGKPRDFPIFALQGGDLRGFRARPPQMQIDWSFFFHMPGAPADNVQPARAIDTLLATGLGVLPDSIATGQHSLPARNLLRGKALGLPTGQDVARSMGIPRDLILTRENCEVGTGYQSDGKPDESVPDLDPKEKKRLEGLFADNTPFWYYVLKEAELHCQGQHLGPVGGRIVAETFLGILSGDATSYINLQPNWAPRAGEYGCTSDGTFTIQDLLQHTAN